MKRDDEPTYLGYSIEPHYGAYWVRRLMFAEKINQLQAIDILERGGLDGGPLPWSELIRRIDPATK